MVKHLISASNPATDSQFKHIRQFDQITTFSLQLWGFGRCFVLHGVQQNYTVPVDWDREEVGSNGS